MGVPLNHHPFRWDFPVHKNHPAMGIHDELETPTWWFTKTDWGDSPEWSLGDHWWNSPAAIFLRCSSQGFFGLTRGPSRSRLIWLSIFPWRKWFEFRFNADNSSFVEKMLHGAGSETLSQNFLPGYSWCSACCCWTACHIFREPSAAVPPQRDCTAWDSWDIAKVSNITVEVRCHLPKMAAHTPSRCDCGCGSRRFASFA